jgi:hypothetical protein
MFELFEFDSNKWIEKGKSALCTWLLLLMAQPSPSSGPAILTWGPSRAKEPGRWRWAAVPGQFRLTCDEACGVTAARAPWRLGEPIWERSGGRELTGGAVHAGAGWPERNGGGSPDAGSPVLACGWLRVRAQWGPHGGETEGGRWP